MAENRDVGIFEVMYRGKERDHLGEGNEWSEIPGGLTIDSGAAESVMPEEIVSKLSTESEQADWSRSLLHHSKWRRDGKHWGKTVADGAR